MPEVNGNEALIVGALVLLALLVAWWIFRRRPPRVRAETPDVLTPGAAPAERNALLVEAPPAAVPVAPAMPSPFVPMGEMARSAMEDEQAATALTAGGDDLTRIKGLGPKLQTLLNQLGVTRFEQIAGWGEAEIAAIDPQLGAFQGRIVRDAWVEQARYLAAGDVAGFEARFGKI